MKYLLLDCTIDICNTSIGVKIFHEKNNPEVKDNYHFELSHHLKDKDDSGIYGPSNMSESLEGCISQIKMYKDRFKSIDRIEENSIFQK